MTTSLLPLLDLILIGVMLLLGAAALHSRRLDRSIVVFIAFGLVAALVWARLGAPDVALAEAAIGAGLTGALLLAALRATATTKGGSAPDPAAETAGPWVGGLVTLLTAALAAAGGWALLAGLQRSDGERLAGQVLAELEVSGVSNPVTAVLLNFRAYDTLLELAVLLAALLGILSLGPARRRQRSAGPILAGLSAWLVPLLVLTAGYQLWVGAHAPGGAFQAGALLAGAGVVLHLAGRTWLGLPRGLALRALGIGGIGVFLLVGLATLWTEGGFLDYPQALAGGLILLIEGFATVAIAATLILSYLGGEPGYWRDPTLDDPR